MISRPVPSPSAWTMRCRPCAPSSPSLSAPSASRSKRTPWRSATRSRPGAAAVIARTDVRVAQPGAGGERVPRRAAPGRRRGRPPRPCRPAPRRTTSACRAAPPVSTTTGTGASASAVVRPAMPPPTTTTGAPSGAGAAVRSTRRSHRQHPLDGLARPAGDVRLDGDLGDARSRGSRGSSRASCASCAGTGCTAGRSSTSGWAIARLSLIEHSVMSAIGLGRRSVTNCDICAVEPEWSAAATTSGGHSGWASTTTPGFSWRSTVDLERREPLVHLAGPGPGDDLDPGLGGDVPGQVLVRDHDDPVRAERLEHPDGVARGAADVRLGLHRGGGVDVGDHRHAGVRRP